MSDNYRRERDGFVDTMEALEHLKEMVTSAKGIPFSDNCIVGRADMLYWIEQVREGLPEEIMQSRDLLAQSRQIVESARQKGDSILLQKEQQSARLVNEHEITLRAREQAQQLVEQAQQNAWRMRVSGNDYLRQQVDMVVGVLTEVLIEVQKAKTELK